MKITTYRTIGLSTLTGIILLAGCGESTAPVAQTVPANASQLFVDVNQILTDSKAFKSVKEQMDQYTSKFQQGMSAKETELKAEETQLKDQQQKLAPTVFETKREAFEKKVNELQQEIMNQNATLQNSYQAALKTIQDQLSKILKERYPGQVVMASNVAMSYPDNLDITKDVLQELDRKIPTVAVKLVEPTAEAKSY